MVALLTVQGQVVGRAVRCRYVLPDLHAALRRVEVRAANFRLGGRVLRRFVLPLAVVVRRDVRDSLVAERNLSALLRPGALSLRIDKVLVAPRVELVVPCDVRRFVRLSWVEYPVRDLLSLLRSNLGH